MRERLVRTADVTRYVLPFTQPADVWLHLWLNYGDPGNSNGAGPLPGGARGKRAQGNGMRRGTYAYMQRGARTAHASEESERS